MSILGTRVVRTEDPRLLTAGGTYTDDLRLPELAGALRVTFVRSPVAHAEITGIDAKAALDSPGVVAVLTAADADDLPPASRPTTEPLLATDRVRYVGEPVAIVLTEDGYQGEDAAELVSVDYQPLAAVAGVDAALADESLLFPAAGSNVLRSGGGPAPDGAFDGCDVVVQRTFPNQRVAPVPLEVRAAAATWSGGRLTLWASTQNAQQARDQVAEALGLDAAAVRVITPDVGGGFGAKIATDRDTIVVAWAARAARPAAALGGDPEREPAGHGARPGPAAHDPDRRHPGRPDPGLPPGHRPGLRGLPAVRAVPAHPDPADGERRL